MNDWQKKWLDDWAWPIVSCDPEHLAECQAMGGASSKPDCEANFRDLRYPGYISSSYEPGGILCVGMVHNGNELFSDAFQEVENATQEWIESSRMDDSEYLACVQRGYASSILGWGPWMELGPAVKKILGIQDDSVASSIAYTNIAKCWTVPRTGKDRKIMRSCAREHPVRNLVEIINPSLIIAWGISIPKNLDWGISPVHETVYKIYAGRGKYGRGDRENGETFKIWVASAKKIYWDAQSRKLGDGR